MERLQKLIAASGICSRRAAEELILQGKVRVNGAVVRELGTKAGEADVILVNNKPLPKPQTVTYLLNKPRGVVCSMARQADTQIITDLVPPYPPVFPIGRLDKESEGLILLTNDGELANTLTHPKFEHAKEYWVTCRPEVGFTPDYDLIKTRLLKGVKLGDGDAKADSINIRTEGKKVILSITVHEGRHHLIRRMCATQRLDVDRLKRVKIGTLELASLKTGAWRVLTEKEISRLRA
jgi:23S rRNA pseudouridine2605 synthase